jgi:hypothetical protein
VPVEFHGTDLHAADINGIHIRQANGLFSLNDLHRASGTDAHKRPGEFLRLGTTKALVAEIQIAGNPAITAKPKIGTYACRELVIAYAAWISPAFQLKVIRVFLSASAPAMPVQPEPKPPTLAGRRWIISIDDDGREQVRPMAWDECTMRWANLAHVIADPDNRTDSALLAEIASACVHTLAKRSAQNHSNTR